MQYKVHNIQPLKKEFLITLASEEVNHTINHECKQYQKTLSISGFRKGKVPVSYIKTNLLDQIFNKIKTRLISHYIDSALKEAKIDMALNLKFISENTPLRENQEYAFKIQFEEIPEIDVSKNCTIKVTDLTYEIKEKEIYGLLSQISAERHPSIHKGDTVLLEVHKPENFISNFMDSKWVIELDAETEKEFQGITDMLEGLKPNEQTSKNIRVSGHSQLKQYCGKSISLSVRVLYITRFDKLTIKDTKKRITSILESLQKQISLIYNLVKNEKEKQIRNQIRIQVFSQLTKEYPAKTLPQSTIQNQTASMEKHYANELKNMGMDTSRIQKTLEKEKNETKAKATQIIHASFVLYSLSKKLNISPTAQEISNYVKQTYNLDPKDLDYQKMQNTLFDITTEKTLYHLIKNAEKEKASPSSPPLNIKT